MDSSLPPIATTRLPYWTEMTTSVLSSTKKMNGDSAPIVLEHIIGHDGTIYSALRLWSAKNGPVVYNRWQSVYFQLKKMGLADILLPEERGSKVLQTRLRAIYAEVHSSLYGAGYVTQAILAQQRNRAKENTEADAKRGRLTPSRSIRRVWKGGSARSASSSSLRSSLDAGGARSLPDQPPRTVGRMSRKITQKGWHKLGSTPQCNDCV